MKKLFLPLVMGVALLTQFGCAREPKELPPGVLIISVEQQSSWVRNFNPISAAAAARWGTASGIFEPLFVFNSVKGEFVPWLATSYEWSEDQRSLFLTIRDGVLWSDGEAFSRDDVIFTFELLRQHASLDRGGIWNFIEAIRPANEKQIEFRFKKIFAPGFDAISAQQIVPQHIWSNIEDPNSFTNPDPVGTGPFTEVRVFRNQVYEMGRNPHYWQEGKPAVEALRFPALPSNDRANLALVFDEVDWAGNFIPAVDRVYVGRDPEHHKYWFPLTGSCIFLYSNNLTPPYDDANVRKALSMAVNRKALLEVALFNYSRPADATGLSDAYVPWRSPDIPGDDDWTLHDPEGAIALLEAAGLKLDEEGRRLGPDGKPWRPTIMTVSGWSDWVRAAQVLVRDLEVLGIEAKVQTLDFGAWFQRVQKGDFELSMGWSFEGPTPYDFYRWLMASDTFRPLGESALGNWHRHQSERADKVFAAFELATDDALRKGLVLEMQRLFVDEAPAIPLYPNPSWAEFNTRRFEGFPSAENPYCDPSPNKAGRGETLLVLTNLKPRGAN